MITDNTKEFWEKASREKDWREYILPGRTEDEFWEEGKAQAEALMNLFNQEGTVLEFGCGIGRVLSQIWAKHRIGVDACQKWLDIAARYGIETVQSNGLKIALPDNTADFIYSLMVFQHTPKDRHPAMIAELFRVLKPGGKMIIQFPRAESGYYKESSFVNVYHHALIRSMMYATGIESYNLTEWDLHAYADGKKGNREWLLTIEK